jgi:oligopeptide transport system permease protein
VTALAESESPSPAPAAEEPGVRTRGYWAQAFRRLRRQPVTLAAFALLVTVVVVGLLSQQLAPQHWNHIDLSPRWANHGPTVASHHWLGTDHIGRDVVARTLWGLHYTEQTALVGALAATLLGIAIGGLAGFYGGWTDAVLMRIVDLITGFPVIVLMIAAFAFLTPVTVFEATLVFSLAMWTFVARVVRGSPRCCPRSSCRRRGASARRTRVSSSATCCRTPPARSSSRPRRPSGRSCWSKRRQSSSASASTR